MKRPSLELMFTASIGKAIDSADALIEKIAGEVRGANSIEEGMKSTVELWAF